MLNANSNRATLGSASASRASSRFTTLARVVSIVLHPFVSVSVLAGLAGPQSFLIVVLFLVVPIAILMVAQVSTGRWTNSDASYRHERPILFGLSGLGLLALAGWLTASDPQSPLLRGLLGPVGLLGTSALLNRWVKVSLHVGFATLCAAALLLLGSPAAWAGIAAVPLVAWSRLVLRRHTPLEVAAGLILGGAGSLLIR